MISEVQLRPKMRLECLLGDFSLLYSLLLLSFIDVSNGFNECVGFLDYLEVVLMFHLANLPNLSLGALGLLYS